MRMSKKLRSPRHEELELLMRMIPKVKAYGLSLQPNGSDYKYCRTCRIYFNNAESLIVCPICHYRLRGPRKAKKLKKGVDPTMYGVEAG
jgi:uncharacterized paraquat-inducible protein A